VSIAPSQPPGAPTKKRKRRSEWGDEHIATEPEDDIPINPPIDDEEDDRPPLPLKSVIGVDVEGTGAFHCPVDEHEDDGAVFFSHPRRRADECVPGRRWGFLAVRVEMRRLYNSKHGYKMLSCDHCKL
jgi:hypothetical protein